MSQFESVSLDNSPPIVYSWSTKGRAVGISCNPPHPFPLGSQLCKPTADTHRYATPFPTATSTPFPTAMPALAVYEVSVIEYGCDAADKMLRILEGGIGRDEEFSEKVLERGMRRVIQDYDSNEDALDVHMDAMVEAVLVAEQNHGYPSKLTEPSLMVGNMLKNWANTLDIYDYRNVLVSLEVFLDTCSEMGGSQ